MAEKSSIVIYNGEQQGQASTGNISTNSINDLSDDTLRYILSLLSTREAARTSILSKKWENVWKSSGSIKLDMDEVLGVFPHVIEEPCLFQRIKGFVRLVYECLRLDSNTLIRTFDIHLCSGGHHDHIRDWIRMAIGRQVQELIVDLSGTPEYCDIPLRLLFREGELRLKHLSLTSCLFSLRRDDEFTGCNSLSSLALVDVILPMNFHDFISHCCPQLRCLTLQHCKGLVDLKIADQLHNLKCLKLVSSGERLRVYARSLVEFECSDFREVFLYSSIDEMGGFHSIPLGDTVYPRFIRAFGGFECLRVLRLQHANFAGGPLENLLANCSHLEQLYLEECDMPSDASTLEISRLASLGSLKVSKCRGLREIRVFATSLKSFVFISNNVELFPRDDFELLDNNGSKFSSRLKHLDLQGCKFSIDLPQFSYLETLTLREVHLEEEDIMDLFSYCLLLEKLSIKNCDGFLSLSVIGPSLRLKQLIVSGCKHLKEIEIRDPNLIRLEYHGAEIVFSLREVPRLTDVEMDIDVNDDTTLIQALSMLSRDVPQLEMLIFYIEGGKVPDDMPMFYNLKHLVLFLGRYGPVVDDLSWATMFLNASPFLEKYQLQLSRYLVGDACTLPWSWMHRYLKEVELFGFRGDDREIDFGHSLLRNAKSLEKMKIHGGLKHRDGDNGWYIVQPPLAWIESGQPKTRQEMSKVIVPKGVELVII